MNDYGEDVTHWFHVTSSRNRASVTAHGLDWRRMGAAPGIAGSAAPEQQGCFLCREDDVDWFVAMNNTGDPCDVWAVSGVDEEALVLSPEGYEYLPAAIPPDRLKLVRADAVPLKMDGGEDSFEGPSGSISVTFRDT